MLTLQDRMSVLMYDLEEEIYCGQQSHLILVDTYADLYDSQLSGPKNDALFNI